MMSPPSGPFWNLALEQHELSERERIQRIEKGLDSAVVKTIGQALMLSKRSAAELANTSESTLARLQRNGGRLNAGGSERIDRVLALAKQAIDVIEDPETAIAWLSTGNLFLGGASPVMLCCTDLGGHQARRLLTGIEWGVSV
jgi:putative toxin-antitoxin system antitoxin component (TIGR02293 family)